VFYQTISKIESMVIVNLSAIKTTFYCMLHKQTFVMYFNINLIKKFDKKRYLIPSAIAG